MYPNYAASGVGYGQDFAGNSHRHVPDGWLPAVKSLVEELGADVNAGAHNSYTPLPKTVALLESLGSKNSQQVREF